MYEVVHNPKYMKKIILLDGKYHVAFIEKCFILPEFRGKGLQKKMILKNISCARFHHVLTIFSMCSPINFASLSNFEKTEFKRIGDVGVPTPRGESYSRFILERRIEDWK